MLPAFLLGAVGCWLLLASWGNNYAILDEKRLRVGRERFPSGLGPRTQSLLRSRVEKNVGERIQESEGEGVALEEKPKFS